LQTLSIAYCYVGSTVTVDGYCYIYPLFDYMSSRENTEKQNDSCDNSLISPSVLICHPTLVIDTKNLVDNL
jgi:hypothetical protein